MPVDTQSASLLLILLFSKFNSPDVLASLSLLSVLSSVLASVLIFSLLFFKLTVTGLRIFSYNLNINGLVVCPHITTFLKS